LPIDACTLDLTPPLTLAPQMKHKAQESEHNNAALRQELEEMVAKYNQKSRWVGLRLGRAGSQAL
jgi:hypothetical protein